MNKSLLSVFIFLLTTTLFSQILYEEGYYIDKSGNKVAGFIENNDWNDNPVSFNFKTAKDSEIQIKNFDGVLEFGLENLRFSKFKVQIDLSRDRVRELTSERAPLFSEKFVFLKYIQDGKADLFMYQDNSVLRYFYRLDEDSPKQLVYKKFLQGGKIAVNNHYQQQLFNDLNCENNTSSNVSNVSYNRIDLERYFTKYNNCKNWSTSYYNNNSSGKFNLKVLLGADFTGMEIDNGLNAGGESFGTEFFIRAGAELEYIMPFNRNKWSIFIQPIYRNFMAERNLTKSYNADFSISSQSLELALGLRHYIFLNTSTKLFINVLVSSDLPLKTEVSFMNTNMIKDPYLDEFKSGTSFGIGAGLEVFNRLALELRYNSSRNLKGSKYVDRIYSLNFESSYSTTSVILTYSLL
ncbi:hypothetical protein [Gillisia sp. CAL575]|uniref:hypothetical protein n=1 Tax=Gillisia sp. CAL575 TaxID=985255 RepID=UPI00039AA9B7|nr:hypothetical protein [Gillisia sp. CAL575]